MYKQTKNASLFNSIVIFKDKIYMHLAVYINKSLGHIMFGLYRVSQKCIENY